MRLTAFRRAPRFTVLLAVLFGLACIGKPSTADALIFTDCGLMPPKTITCLDALPPGADDAQIVRCYMLTVNEQDAEIDALRAQFSACATGHNRAAAPAARRWWQRRKS